MRLFCFLLLTSLFCAAATTAGAQEAARLQLVGSAEQQTARLHNPYAGPLEVRLDSRGGVPQWSRPGLPLRRVLQAGETATLADVGPLLGNAAELTLEQVPGTPLPRRPAKAVWLFPLQSERIELAQGYGGPFSHREDASYFALDFATPEGTPVLAARDGTVMQVIDHYSGGGWDPERYNDRANLIRLLHDDGSMSLYAHLQRGGARVRTGQRVRAGEVIGLSGNTGLSAKPHLHFVVQFNRGLHLDSMPVDLSWPDGRLRLRSTISSGR